MRNLLLLAIVVTFFTSCDLSSDPEGLPQRFFVFVSDEANSFEACRGEWSVRYNNKEVELSHVRYRNKEGKSAGVAGGRNWIRTEDSGERYTRWNKFNTQFIQIINEETFIYEQINNFPNDTIPPSLQCTFVRMDE